jgi:uncharacterized protein
MPIVFDPHKDSVNYQKHGVSLAEADRFEWDTAVVWADLRQDYGENRHIAIGYIGLRLYVLVFVEREPETRIISLRKANQREIKRYAET